MCLFIFLRFNKVFVGFVFLSDFLFVSVCVVRKVCVLLCSFLIIFLFNFLIVRSLFVGMYVIFFNVVKFLFIKIDVNFLLMFKLVVNRLSIFVFFFLCFLLRFLIVIMLSF